MLNLDTSVAYLNYLYLCFVLLAITASQRLKVHLFTKLFQPLKCSSRDLAVGVSDYSPLMMLIAGAEVT